MRRLLITIIGGFMALYSLNLSAQELPKNTNKLVNDFTNTLSTQEKAALTKKAASL